MNLPNKENTCIVVVTYNPDDSFVYRIERHFEIANKIVIVDNGSIKNIENVVRLYSCDNRLKIILSSVNKGIAWGLNQGIAYAISEKYEYVLTFDQDSFPVANILDLYSTIFRKNIKIGLIGTKYTEETIERDFSKIEVEKNLTLITSGTLHPIEVFTKVGFYEENLFIDSVDFDYSLRVNRAGYIVFRTKQELIKHQLGTPKRKWLIVSTNHSPIRRYYMARNHIYLTKKYFSTFPFWIIKKNIFFLKNIVEMLFVDDNLKLKCKKTIKGIYDGIKM